MSARRTSKAHAGDRPFLLICIALFITGLIILASASVALAQRDYGSGYYYVLRQLLFGGGLGLGLAFIAQIVPLRYYKRFALAALVGTIILLILVFVPGIGVGTKGAMRWIDIGLFTIQPGEIARVTFPWFLAAWFMTHKISEKRETEAQDILIPFLIIVASVTVPLLLQPDLSTLGIIAITGLFMYFLAGGSWRLVTALVGAGVAALLLLIRIAPYRMNRILAFLDPQADPLGIGYQVNQALLAVGSGGLLGRGLGFSREKLFFLPEPMGDAIFAVLAEEIGFVGSLLIVALFLAFLWRGLYIVRRLDDPFMRLFAAGLVLWIVLQAFLNIAGNIALAPLIGVTLPFISYGNASLAMTLLSVAIIYRFSRYTKSQPVDVSA